MWTFTISPEVVAERELRARLLGRGVNREKMQSILETDERVTLRAVRTGRAADARVRTLKSMIQIDEEEKRLETADGGIRDLLSGKQQT